MKKVGILTFHNSNNYGALLQTYALEKTCEKLGFDTSIINYVNKNVITKSPEQILINDIKKFNIKNLIKDIIGYLPNKKKYIKMQNFRKKMLNIEKEIIYDNDKIKDIYDFVIVGSDQVWNLDITKKFSNILFLNYRLTAKKISYAASTGNCFYSKENLKKISHSLRNFDKISIREYSDKKRIEEISQKRVSVVLDPTLLLQKKEWDNLIVKNKRITKKYILVYTVEENDEIVNLVNEISKLTNLKVIYFTKLAKYKNKFKSVFTSGIEDFLFYFKNAEYVITNSFHGTVFSILFEKNFFVINHKERGKRISDLLNSLDLNNQVIKKGIKNLKEYEIDYEKVNKLLENLKKDSLKFLIESLNGSENK